MTPIDFSLIQQIDQLNEQAWQYRVNNAEELIVCCTEALRLTKQTNYKKGEADEWEITNRQRGRERYHNKAYF